MNWYDQRDGECRVVRDSLIRVPTCAGNLMVDAYRCSTKYAFEQNSFEKYIVSLDEKEILETSNQFEAHIAFTAARRTLLLIDKDWEDADAD